MRDDERRALAEVRDEFESLRRLLEVHPLAGPVSVRLEATYLIRLYARFEGLLRDRMNIAIDDENYALSNCIQSLTGNQVGYDPANDGLAMPWWQLFRRDRNLLAHGRSLFPAIGLETTRSLMEEYLSRLRD